MATTANDLHSSFMLGRSEAARSKTFVTVCASAADANSDPAKVNNSTEHTFRSIVDLLSADRMTSAIV
jgi:Tfp pilus assembly protein FimT